ncbi:MAG: restriction endonuclease FokI C-terminal domain-containing protein [Planctomycetia bacterium]|nr:restriction endonuclease FokI C-terminal domain-containing protein [Planctomycetia bacterium]
MAYTHWFVSRQKRRLTTILQALVAYSDVCVGKVWNHDLQLDLEDVLGRREITEHGSLRARRAGAGGGGTRTLFKQMKDLGLVFLEDENRKCRMTLIGEELVKGNLSFVDAMRLQLKRYQYPSAAVWSGTGSVDHSFKVHPFQFMFRLLREPSLDNTLSMEEMYGIVIHRAVSDAQKVFDDVVARIIRYRQGVTDEFVYDTDKKTFSNIANTFFNYISLTQYIDRGWKTISIRHGKETAVDAFIEKTPAFIPHPELTENYQRRYGRGKVAKDLRNFDRESSFSQKELDEARIRREYVLMALKTPIIGITPDIVEYISLNTGVDEKVVERFLIQNYPHGNIDDFFVAYKELAHMGVTGARDFEAATCEMFRKIFRMRAEHIGSQGNTPDVFVESTDAEYCGIIDNKAYKDGYSISGDHKRVMEDVYIPNYKAYGRTEQPLAFFAYIAGSFGSNINSQILTITRDTGVNGSAMPVDIFIDLAQDYATQGHDHHYLRSIFSVNREVQLSDLRARKAPVTTSRKGCSKR